jgi:crooked neck
MPTDSCFFNSQEYLQFEIDENEFDMTRELYERLLDRTKHLKVWISYAEFEASAGLNSEDGKSEENKNEVGYQEQQLEHVRKCRGKYCVRTTYVVQPHITP